MSTLPASHWKIEPAFFDGAAAMRAEFEARVEPARRFSRTRLVWDYWYVDRQYAYVRCLARQFFSPSLYRNFLAAVRRWGELHLGCADCSELWISYYVDGCYQNFHTDVGNGAWALVFSLTPPGPPAFSGGETVLLQPATLDYWRHFASNRPVEHEDLLYRIPPLFNQLLAFDARIPHAVHPVYGTRDPMRARVVVHGWFTAPALSVRGGLTRARVNATTDALASAWKQQRAGLGALDGCAVLKLGIADTGSVREATVLATTLASLDGRPQAAAEALALALQLAGGARFPGAAASSEVLLPFIAADR
jgi:hypothetical protein